MMSALFHAAGIIAWTLLAGWAGWCARRPMEEWAVKDIAARALADWEQERRDEYARISFPELRRMVEAEMLRIDQRRARFGGPR